MILCLNVHPDRAHDLLGPDEMMFSRPVAQTPFFDMFGNRCLRILGHYFA